MAKEFTRKELYDLVWSRPLMPLARTFDLSTVGLAKACRIADIPFPDDDYWSQQAAGAAPRADPLPDRGLGKSDIVRIGGNPYLALQFDFLNLALRPKPVFDDEAALAQRVKTLVGTAAIVRWPSDPHPVIRALLDANASRKRKADGDPWYWNTPQFDGAFEQRRLGILNTLFHLAQASGFSPGIEDERARITGVTVGDQHIGFVLDSSGALKDRSYARRDADIANRAAADGMRLVLSTAAPRPLYPTSWEDADGDPLEDRCREIVEAIAFYGEIAARDGIMSHYNWLSGRKQAAVAAEEARLSELEHTHSRKRRDLERRRIDVLLSQADNFHKAETIRGYIARARQALHPDGDAYERNEFEAWAQWATAEADRIDPVMSEAYLAHDGVWTNDQAADQP